MEADIYKLISGLEGKHWWYVARRLILEDLIRKNNLPAKAKIYEVGCGSGGNLPMLAKFGEVYAGEMNDWSRDYANKRNIAKTIEYTELPGKPAFINERFDLIVMLDVIEHIENDKASLEVLKSQLNDNGKLIITVPAYSFLWSKFDELSHHKRRYTRNSISNVANAAGFKINYVSYFNFFLFPIIACFRIFGRFLEIDHGKTDFKIPGDFVNRILTRIFAAERFLLGKMSFPFGGSIILVASK